MSKFPPGSVAAPSLRLAKVDDIPQMHRVRMMVWENRLTDPRRVQPHDYQQKLISGRGWVCEVDERIVGFGIADLAAGSVWALFVDPAFEGRGIGRKLHDAMVAWLFASGATKIWLTTDPGTRAEQFYVSAGWARVGDGINGEVRYELEAT
jgi:GNAT superfamily N-acetyltransferase